jgi:hypothetical protein
LNTIAADIKKHLLRYAVIGFDFKTTEFSPYHSGLRFDIFALNRYNKTSRIVEVKSCRADFVADKKWKNYLPFATHFYFAAPKGVINPNELPAGIGLIETEVMKNGFLAYEYTKKCRKIHTLSNENYTKLIEGAFMRLKYELKEYCGRHGDE